uniref:AB hydrolase-1 domain-containing protein n=1 Tax=Fagus sylvatica TaxID=28930 RepID=A0A2N9HH24_FAGSY
MGVPYLPPGPATFDKHLPEGFYISRWREPGRAEADFGRFDAKTVVRNVYILFSKSEIPIAAEDQEIMDLVDPSTPLPPWFTEEDLAAYGALYEKSGFQTALQVPYRSFGEDINMADPIVKHPALFIMGSKDYVLKFPGMEDYINSGTVKEFVPNLEITFLPDGTHFVHEQSPDEVNQLILSFLGKHPSNPYLMSKRQYLIKDFGARLAYLFAILHPKRVLGVITLGVPFMPERSTFHKYLPEGFYMSRWQEPGRAKADYRRLDAKTIIRNIYILFSRSEIPIAAENQEIMDLVDSSTPLPLWFTEEDLTTYGALYEKSGFQTALQIPHRSVGKDFTITDAKVKVPVLLIMGGKDYILKFQGMEDYIKSGKVKEVVPNLEITFLPEGTHFVQEQSPNETVCANSYPSLSSLPEFTENGPHVIVFLHGFPEIWYTWRHQMIAVAKAGFRAIAPDYRGYGLSDPPPQPEKALFSDLITDLLGILDALQISKVFLIAKDFGAWPAYVFANFHPERVLGVVTMGVPYLPPGSATFDKEPGRAEADFGRFDAKTVVKNVYILFSKSEIPIAAENQEIMDLVDPSTPLPPWFTEEDLAAYGALYEKSGFQTALQLPYSKDYVLKFPGIEDYINSGTVKEFVPNLEITFLPEGTHFVHEQSPDEVNQLILSFLGKHHKFVDVQGLKLHVAEVGTGPNVVVFLHGFPEIWYSWRHQMIALANAGFRAIAPDHRGYGLSDRPPPQLNKASFVDLITDLLTLLDALQISKVFLVAKDFGARPAYLFAILHPKKEGFYMSRWQELGQAEADCRRLDAKTVIRNIYILFSRSEIPIAAENQEIMDLVDSSTPLPLWFTEEDLTTYGALYEKSGFQTALQIPHRSVGKDFTITDAKVKVPVLLIMGGKDYILKFQGMEDYIKSGNVKKVVPNLEITFLPQGTHFVQEQSPDEVNHLIFTFLGKHV